MKQGSFGIESVRWCVAALAATGIGGAGFGIGSAAAAPADPTPEPSAATAPPTLAFFRNPDIRTAALSPSGRWLGIATASPGGRMLLAVLDLDHVAAGSKVVAAFDDADIRSFAWVNDERLVFNVFDGATERPDQRFGAGLYGVRRDGGEIRPLIRHFYTPFLAQAPARAGAVPPLEPNHELLATLSDGSNQVVVGEHRWTLTGEPDGIVPKRLDVTTGRTESLAAGTPPKTYEWLFDRAGVPRVSVASSAGETRVARRLDDGSWQVIERSPVLRERIAPLAVDNDGTVYAETPSKDGYGVVRRLDASTGTAESEPLLGAPGFDATARALFDTDSGRLAGLRLQTDAEVTVWYDARMRALQAEADLRFPGHVNRLECRRCHDDGALLVMSYSDRDPGRYWLRRARGGTWEPIGAAFRGIEPQTMATLDFVRAKARDGGDLPLWVTVPAGSLARTPTPRPAVLLVHGGPAVRGGYWRWNPEAQFLASRGYVVIEPEFRGSAGYGSTHLRAGFRQWGRTMQTDLVDAVRWAAAKGLVDPRRVCIAGASYGGYATLMGLALDPDTFRCGVAWVAVTDPRSLLEENLRSDLSEDARLYSLPTMIGDLRADAVQLKETAPVEQAARIKAPLLMAFGSDDRRVPLEHGQRMRDALLRAGHPPEYVVYDGEGHGWSKVATRIDFWNRVDRFLAANLR